MGKAKVFSGLDNLNSVHPILSGKRVGLMTHPCGISRALESAIDILNANYNLTALFACEHGIRGDVQAGAKVDNDIDRETGKTVYSLYGKTQMPTDEMMDKIDVMVVDLQDVGARFYTYLYSMAYAMIACAKHKKPIVILDRMNPVGGSAVQGTMLDEKLTAIGETIGQTIVYVYNYLDGDEIASRQIVKVEKHLTGSSRAIRRATT